MKLKQVELKDINSFSKDTLLEQLGMECIELGEDYLKVRMPVDERTKQPMGLLHGGASAALIETVGSMGSTLLLDMSKEVPVGLEVNANHVGAARDGFVVANGKLVHAGRRTHLWQVEITHESSKKLVCTGRLTVMVIPSK